jgi:hypothetical protein
VTRNERDDDALVREALRDVKAHDARSMRSFQTVLARAERRRSLFPLSPAFRFVVAGIAIAAMIAGYRAFLRANRFAVPPEVVALTQWRAASDVLLPDSTFLAASTTRLDDSMLNFTILVGRPPQ